MFPKAKQCATPPAIQTRFVLQDAENDVKNLPAVCRVCLVMGVRMYEMSEHWLSAMYTQVTNIVINAEDKLPRELCWECVARLSSANNFIAKALRTHWVLSDKLTNGRHLTMSDITSIDRAQHLLESRLSNNLINHDEASLHMIEHSIETNIKDEDVSDLDSNNYNEDYVDTDILKFEEEINYNLNAHIGNAHNEIDRVKSLVDAGDERAAADDCTVTFKERDSNEKLAFIAEDENMKSMRCEEEFFDNKSCNEFLEPHVTQGTQCPKTAETEYHSSMENITLKIKNNTKKPCCSTDAIELFEDEATENKSITKSDNTSHTNADTNSVGNLFICDNCDKPFHSKSTIIKHIQNHPRFYNRVNSTFESHLKSNISRQMNSQHSKKTSYRCTHCYYKTCNKHRLGAHINSIHTKSTSYSCTYCSYKTYNKSYLRQHIKSTHTKNSPYSCSECSYETCIKSRLAVHINSKHAKHTSYSCTYCSFKTYNKHYLNLHINSQHTKSTSYNCSDCSYETYHKRSLTKHINIQHTKSTSYSRCTFCSYKTFNKHYLRQHINSLHTKSTSYSCTYCSYKTYNKTYLRQHIKNTHTKNTSYNCSECSYETSIKGSLAVHINSQHMKHTSYSCPYCSYKTYNKYYVKKHINSQHTKITSYNCSYCSYITYNKINLNKHTLLCKERTLKETKKV